MKFKQKLLQCIGLLVLMLFAASAFGVRVSTASVVDNNITTARAEAALIPALLPKITVVSTPPVLNVLSPISRSCTFGTDSAGQIQGFGGINLHQPVNCFAISVGALSEQFIAHTGTLPDAPRIFVARQTRLAISPAKIESAAPFADLARALPISFTIMAVFALAAAPMRSLVKNSNGHRQHMSSYKVTFQVLRC